MAELPYTHDRVITISAAGSRKATRWPAQDMLWSDLVDRLRQPVRGQELLAEYMRWPKSQQDEAKDVGGYVAGPLTGERRKAGCVAGRDVVTLDLDNIPAGGTEDVLRRISGLGCGYCVYSTRKHDPAKPRLRVLTPLSRTCTADEYEPIARRLAAWIGIELCDPSTFEASRLMYWPSCCADSQYVYCTDDKPMLDADGVLATYTDWKHFAEWPQVPGVPERTAKLAAKQEDPTSKPGVVGAFCRVYDIFKAIDELIPGEYVPCDDSDGSRWTYAGGSTTGGAVVYDNGKFLYSHHATDPAGGKLCNAFDLVRLHKFGDQDNDALPSTPANKLPSYTAMCQLAVADPQVAHLLDTERYNQAVEAFGAEPTDGDSADWMRRLKRNPNTGVYDKTIDNAWIVLEHDPQLQGKFALNEFANRGEVFGPLPWDPRAERRQWEDNDNCGMYWYAEKVYHITGKDKIDGALSLHSNRHRFNEIVDYLSQLKWDGVPRLDRLFIDYLGAEDTPYVRAVTRKAFTAAVARAMAPGTKFDIMTVLSGAQGIGKSTLLRKLAHGWFNDGMTTFEGKEASELVQGVWIVEIAEMHAMKRVDINRIKQFLSQQSDRYRAAYARHVKECPRRCVFFGTSNNREYLVDTTGNRRFWPVDVGAQPPTKNVFRELDAEVDQIWAEAVISWQLGEPLFLSGDVEEAAKAEQESHREQSPLEGLIQEFLDRPVPDDWLHWDLNRRRMYWSDALQGEVKTVPRDRVCAMEVWCEVLRKEPGDMRNADAREINALIDRQLGWKKYGKPSRFGYCNLQRGFFRDA